MAKRMEGMQSRIEELEAEIRQLRGGEDLSTG